MTRYEPQTIESDALPDAVDVLGVDGDGRTHYVTPPTTGDVTIYVETAAGFDVFDVDAMPIGDLEDWIDHVGTQRGWHRLCYTDDFGAHLADRLGEAV